MPGYEEDLSSLEKLSVTVDGTLKNILEEVLSCSRKVVDHDSNAKTSGYAARLFKYKDKAAANSALKGYRVVYQGGNLGNLVHELTHIAVNEAYERDFVNFMCTAQGAPDPDFDPGPGEKYWYMKNEFIRQTYWMNHSDIGPPHAKLNQLIKLAETIHDEGQKKDLVEKLQYGVLWPHKEYDTVINQVLLWLHKWGYSSTKISEMKNLYTAVMNAAKEAYVRRQNARKSTSSGAIARRDANQPSVLTAAIKAPLDAATDRDATKI